LQYILLLALVKFLATGMKMLRMYVLFPKFWPKTLLQKQTYRGV